jgi:hypothetical protein
MATAVMIWRKPVFPARSSLWNLASKAELQHLVQAASNILGQ